MAANTPQNYHTLGQAPLDAKMTLPNKAAFTNLVSQEPVSFAFNYYKGMVIYFQQEEEYYIWETPFSPYYTENDKLLENDYIYPIGSVYAGIDYSQRAFNLLLFPYKKENLGVWEADNNEQTVEVTIYEGSTVNPFDSTQITNFWPTAERIAFTGGDLTGLKLYGQPIQLFQEFPVSDWDNLTYDIWNNTNGFVQNARMYVALAGEIVDYTQYTDKIIGNSFREIRIAHEDSDMIRKSSFYLKSIGDTFEIYAVDRLGVRRKFVGVGGGGGGSAEKLSLIGNALRLLDINDNVISQVLLGISNIDGLSGALDGKINKPQTTIASPNTDFKYIAILDSNGESRRIESSYFMSANSSVLSNLEGVPGQLQVFPVGGGIYHVGFESSGVEVPTTMTVQGMLTAVKLEVEDVDILMNSDLGSVAPTENVSITVNRGSLPDTKLLWNELSDRWMFTNDGTNFYNIPIPEEYLNSYRTYATNIFMLSGTITHPLNTTDVMIQLVNTANGETVEQFYSKRLSPNQVQVEAFIDYTHPIRVLLVKIG